MRSCSYKPALIERVFSPLKPRCYFLYPTDIVPHPNKSRFIKRITVFLIIFLFLNLASFAQQKITGVVIRPGGSPLSGATVSINGSNVGTVTNVDGSFVITAKEKDVLFISY